MDDIQSTQTHRGFTLSKFKDRYGSSCSLQKSSLASEDAIWFGVDDANPQIMSRDAIKLGLREATHDEKDNGWVPYQIPNEVILATRMHLTQDLVKQLLPSLIRFAETGEL